MRTLITFLRGVNMAGHNKIKMTALSSLYERAGFVNPETYIQSGNVIFLDNTDQDNDAVSRCIEMAIMEELSLDIAVMTRTPAELKRIIAANPFHSEAGFNPSKMACLFARDTIGRDQVEKVRDVDYPPDKFRIIGQEIFIYCPNGFGKTKLYTNFFEKKMKIKGTARNWNTINTILELSLKKTGGS